MAPKLKEIEKLNRGPKPRNVKERVEWLAAKADHYHLAAANETGKYSDSDKQDFSNAEIRERLAILKIVEESPGAASDGFAWAQFRFIGEAYNKLGLANRALEVSFTYLN